VPLKKAIYSGDARTLFIGIVRRVAALCLKSEKTSPLTGFSVAAGPAGERGPQNRVECRPRNEGIGHGFSRALQQFASG